MSGLRVLSVASEIYPIVKTGGLADVAGALPLALRSEGVAVRTLMPGYPAAMEALPSATEVLSWPRSVRRTGAAAGRHACGISICSCSMRRICSGVPAIPISVPTARTGRTMPFASQPWRASRRISGSVLCRLSCPTSSMAMTGRRGLLPAYLHYSHRAHPGTVMTVHNLAFQGRCPYELLGRLGLPPESFSVDGVEYYGSISFLKAGLQFADRITTVSPTYAQEIQGAEQGMGLDGLLRARSGVLCRAFSTASTSRVWDPAHDPAIASPYSVDNLEAAGVEQGGAAAAHGIAGVAGCLPARRRQPPVLAEGPRSAVCLPADHHRRRHATGAARRWRRGSARRVSCRCQRQSRPDRRRHRL